MPAGLPVAFQIHQPSMGRLSSEPPCLNTGNPGLSPADPGARLNAPLIRQSAGKVWLALNNHNYIPEFGPDEGEEPMPPPHPSLNQQIDKLRPLPFWKHFKTMGPSASGVSSNEETSVDFRERIDFAKTSVRAEFRRVLSESRLMAYHLFGMWGDHQAMTLLQLAGRGAVSKAHDLGDSDCLLLCAQAWSLAVADESVRAKLGELAEAQPNVADAVAGFYAPEEKDFYSLALGMRGTPRDAEIMNAISPHAHDQRPVMWLNGSHPRWRADSLLIEAAKLYLNPEVKQSLSVEKIAGQLGESISTSHVESHYALTEGAALHLARQSFKTPLSGSWPVDKAKCMSAFEQACRTFGENNMLGLLFDPVRSDYPLGQEPSPSLDQKAKLKEVLPAMQSFLKGKEADWA